MAKTATKKKGALIPSMKFLSPEVALRLYKSTILPCVECCRHTWAGAASCYVELLDNCINLEDVLQNRLNWSYFFFLVGDLLVILIDCIISLSPFLDVARMPMPTVSLLAQLGSGILCQNASL